MFDSLKYNFTNITMNNDDFDLNYAGNKVNCNIFNKDGYNIQKWNTVGGTPRLYSYYDKVKFEMINTGDVDIGKLEVLTTWPYRYDDYAVPGVPKAWAFKYWEKDEQSNPLSSPLPTWKRELKNIKDNNDIIKYTKKIDIIISDYRNSSNAEESVKYTLNITCEVRASHMSYFGGETDIDTGAKWEDLKIIKQSGINEKDHVWRPLIKEKEEQTSVPPATGH